jgi:polyferredoxin
MTRKARKTLLDNLVWCAILLLLLGVLYVLALGPIALLSDSGFVPEDGPIAWTLNLVYTPLGWLYEESPFCGRILDVYLDLWYPE